MTSAPNIKLLLLEDNPADAKLLRKLLQNASISTEALIVSKREAFEEALLNFKPDLIISDHQLPQYSSTEALETSRKISPFVPFILVTGTASEEFAAGIIRMGADDYLLKNNLVRLPTAVLQAIARRKAEQSLAESQERYEFVSHATSDAVWDWNIVKGTITWNHGIKTLFGYDPISADTSNPFDTDKIHPADRARVKSEVENVLSERLEYWTSTYRYRHFNGSYRHVFDRARILYKDQMPVRIIGAMQDIEDRVRALEEVKRLSIVASETDNAVLILNKNSEIEWTNHGFTRMSGYQLEEVIGKQPFDVLHGPETSSETKDRLIKSMREHVSFTGEILNYSKSGKKYWINITVTPIFSPEGQIEQFVSIQSDITSRKEIERKNTAIALELTNLVENSHAPIFGVDQDGKINEWNRATAQATEYSKEEVMGIRWVDLLGPQTQQKVTELLAAALRGHTTTHYELPFLRKGGKLLILSMSVEPRFDVNGNTKGVICVGEDITEVFNYRQNLERMVEGRTRDLNDALRKEKELVDLKSKFVAIASHEFRTPLSTISFAAQTLKTHLEKLSPDDVRRKLTKIEDQANHMTNLLEDILLLGKSESGRITVKSTKVDLRELVDSFIEEAKSPGQNRKIELQFQSIRRYIDLDDKLFRNILINLLTNALKFSPAESTVVLVVKDFIDGIQIDISDQGIGIPAAELESIFESFYRGSNASSIQGTGLGLSILKKAVELLNGSIRVDSILNKGTTFSVQIPIV